MWLMAAQAARDHQAHNWAEQEEEVYGRYGHRFVVDY
jgi:hypothetical protein